MSAAAGSAGGGAFYRLHLFVCTNRREGDKPSCGAKNADTLHRVLKDRARAAGLTDIRVNKAGCLDQCARGPVLVIYPDGIWYRYENENDIDEILTTHLQHGRVVERLRLGQRSGV